MNAGSARPPFKADAGTLIAIACLILIAGDGWFLFAATRQGLWPLDGRGDPAPVDFSAFWAAGRLILAGKAQAAYDWASLRAVVEASTGHPFREAHYPIFYPPVFLLYLAPLGLFSYLTALLLWLGVTMSAYLAAAYAILPRRGVLLVALAAPAVLWTVCVGQNGLLTAALLGGGLALLDRRPVLAGILFGALVYKPQFGVLIPLVLMASGRWRSFAAAAVTVILLFALSGLVFGWTIFPAFIEASAAANDKLLNVGALPWYKVQSIYGLARMLGADAGVAWGLHVIVAALAAAGVARLWRGDVAYDLKAAALAAATLVVSPYSCIYDLPIITIAIVFLMKDCQREAPAAPELAALGIAFLLPLLFPTVVFPVGPVIYALLGAVIVWRVRWW